MDNIYNAYNFELSAFADEAGKSIDEQIAALRENGISYIEPRNIDGKNFSDYSVEEAVSISNKFKENGITIRSIGSPDGKTKITDDFAPALEHFSHTLEIAKAVGAECIRIFSFYMPKDDDPEMYFDEVVRRLSAFLELAKDSKIKLCHENEKGIYGENADRCLKLHKALPELKCVFDPANFVVCGVNTIDACHMLYEYIEYLHIKDASYDGRILPAGFGDGHIREILLIYNKSGKKALTIEPHLYEFTGLQSLEQSDSKSKVGDLMFEDERAAFDAAVSYLRELI